jgi:predicted phosphodiesterase
VCDVPDLTEALDSLKPRNPDPARRKQPEHPKGWEPGVVWDGTKGTVTTKPVAAPPDNWDDLLKVWDLDPAVYEVVEPVQFRAWDAAIGDGKVQRMYYYRATIRSRVRRNAVDMAELIREVKRHKPRKVSPPTGDSAFVVPISDLQLGKPDGDGTEGTAKRFRDGIALVKARYTELRRIGRTFDTLVVAGLGDIIESCDGHYAMQAYGVELNRRYQSKLARSLIKDALKEWAPDFEKVVVPAVGGNHGENRKDGKAFTDFADNEDVAIFEEVAEAFAENPATYGHVSFVIPDDALTLTLNVGGTIVGFAHGHQAKGGGSKGKPHTKVGEWWKGQIAGRQPIGDADVLVSGHFHYLALERDGLRTHLQVPAMDGGSTWFLNTSGKETIPGFATFVVNALGLDDLKVI